MQFLQFRPIRSMCFWIEYGRHDYFLLTAPRIGGWLWPHLHHGPADFTGSLSANTVLHSGDVDSGMFARRSATVRRICITSSRDLAMILSSIGNAGHHPWPAKLSGNKLVPAAVLVVTPCSFLAP